MINLYLKEPTNARNQTINVFPQLVQFLPLLVFPGRRTIILLFRPQLIFLSRVRYGLALPRWLITRRCRLRLFLLVSRSIIVVFFRGGVYFLPQLAWHRWPVRRRRRSLRIIKWSLFLLKGRLLFLRRHRGRRRQLRVSIVY